ncbi:hypothetical protein [Ochrobactrum quorumnocens]|uniref:hypothetical protein n=1 Tax=Ochrobactrum quorumnocens TaxID=271865 RepID=UPI001FD22D5C|nr:hypothetical protein [[Ochrobactrum] quorumnocens]
MSSIVSPGFFSSNCSLIEANHFSASFGSANVQLRAKATLTLAACADPEATVKKLAVAKIVEKAKRANPQFMTLRLERQPEPINENQLLLFTEEDFSFW